MLAKIAFLSIFSFQRLAKMNDADVKGIKGIDLNERLDRLEKVKKAVFSLFFYKYSIGLVFHQFSFA